MTGVSLPNKGPARPLGIFEPRNAHVEPAARERQLQLRERPVESASPLGIHVLQFKNSRKEHCGWDSGLNIFFWMFFLHFLSVTNILMQLKDEGIGLIFTFFPLARKLFSPFSLLRERYDVWKFLYWVESV